MTSAENTIGTTIMKIDRRKIWPIGRRRFALMALTDADVRVRMERGAEHHAQNEPDEQPDVKLHRQAPVPARFASILVIVTLY